MLCVCVGAARAARLSVSSRARRPPLLSRFRTPATNAYHVVSTSQARHARELQRRVLIYTRQLLLQQPTPIVVIIAMATLAILGWVLYASSSSPPGVFDAIIVCGGGQTPTGPPAHVVHRLRKAAELYEGASKSRPMIIVTSKGTDYKVSPHDSAGFEITEAKMASHWLVENTVVSPRNILEEGFSMDTIGNAHFARLMHTEPLGLKKLAVITSRWHMARKGGL